MPGGNSNRELQKRNELDLVAKWKNYITNKLSVIEVLIKNQQETLASTAPGTGEREEARFLLALYQEQEALLKRGVLFLNNFEQLVLAPRRRVQKRAPDTDRSPQELIWFADGSGQQDLVYRTVCSRRNHHRRRQENYPGRAASPSARWWKRS